MAKSLTRFKEALKSHDFPGRLAQLIQESPYKGNVDRFARACGMASTTLWSAMDTGNTTLRTLRKIHTIKPVDIHWLAIGDGEMHRRSAPVTFAPVIHIESLARYSAKLSRDFEGKLFCSIPLLADPIAAGNPMAIAEDNIEGVVLMHQAWCSNPEMTRAIRVKGDSMHPTIPDESIVILDTTCVDPKDLDGHVVAVRKGDDCSVKRLELAERGTVICRPDNPAHRSVVLQEGDAILGQVISVHAKVV